MAKYKRVSCQTLQNFSKVFEIFIYSKSVFSLLPKCGWLDGGCRSLMKAMQVFLGENYALSYQIVQREDQLHSEHALVKIHNYYIDGDGVSTFREIKKRWIDEELLDNVIIRPFNPLLEPNSISGEEPFYISGEAINTIAGYLNEKFDRENILSLLKT